jgi:hypothetical protein
VINLRNFKVERNELQNLKAGGTFQMKIKVYIEHFFGSAKQCFACESHKDSQKYAYDFAYDI